MTENNEVIIAPLTKEELQRIVNKLNEIEQKEKYDTAIYGISGGFCQVSMFDYDNDFIDIELKWGVQSDCEDFVTTEQFRLNRKTLEMED